MEVFHRESNGEVIPCSDCKADIIRLNRMTSDQVRGDSDSIVDRIAERMKTQAPKMWQRLAIRADLLLSKISGDSQTKQFVARCLNEAIEAGKEPDKIAAVVKPSTKILKRRNLLPSAMNWRKKNLETDFEKNQDLVVGVTACSERVETLLPITLNSLKESGFTIDRLFLDGQGEIAHLDIPFTQRIPAIGPHGNIVLALEELFLRFLLCEKFVLFQDDIICVRNLAPYLTQLEIPEKGWINFTNHPSNEKLGKKAKGCLFRSNQSGHGAIGLMFSREALIAVLCEDLKKEVLKKLWRYPIQIDLIIGKIMKENGFTEYCHYPSLLKHEGAVSTLRSIDWQKNKVNAFFPGENFNAMEFVK